MKAKLVIAALLALFAPFAPAQARDDAAATNTGKCMMWKAAQAFLLHWQNIREYFPSFT